MYYFLSLKSRKIPVLTLLKKLLKYHFFLTLVLNSQTKIEYITTFKLLLEANLGKINISVIVVTANLYFENEEKWKKNKEVDD